MYVCERERDCVYVCVREKERESVSVGYMFIIDIVIWSQGVFTLFMCYIIGADRCGILACYMCTDV